MAHVLSGRAETPTQSRILTLRPRRGPAVADRAGERGSSVSRTTVAAEVGRLVELGLAEDGGPAASRGGRRSTLVDLDAGLRFVGIDLGATSIDVAVTDGRLRVAGRARASRSTSGAGPRPCSPRRSSWSASCCAEQGVDRPAGVGHRRPRPGRLPRRRPGVAADHAGLGPATRSATRCRRELGCPVLVDNDVNIMALGEQHAGRRPLGVATSCSSRSAPASAAASSSTASSTAAPTAAPATSATSGSTTNGPVCACGNVGCLEAFFGGAALARDADRGRARRPLGPCSPSGSRRTGALTAADVGRGRRPGRRRGAAS